LSVSCYYQNISLCSHLKFISVEIRRRKFIIHFAAVVQDNTTAAEPDAERPKKRVVYTTKKKKPTAVQQDTESAPGYSLFGFILFFSAVVLCV